MTNRILQQIDRLCTKLIQVMKENLFAAIITSPIYRTRSFMEPLHLKSKPPQRTVAKKMIQKAMQDGPEG